MKYFTTVLFILMLSVSVACAGSQWESEYDQVWEITVTDCQGNTTIYYDCRITQDGLYVVTFMPNQGKMATGNGPIIRVYRSNCTEVIMVAE